MGGASPCEEREMKKWKRLEATLFVCACGRTVDYHGRLYLCGGGRVGGVARGRVLYMFRDCLRAAPRRDREWGRQAEEKKSTEEDERREELVESGDCQPPSTTRVFSGKLSFLCVFTLLATSNMLCPQADLTSICLQGIRGVAPDKESGFHVVTNVWASPRLVRFGLESECLWSELRPISNSLHIPKAAPKV